MSDNPYLPPSADIRTEESEDEGLAIGPYGDLELALSGEVVVDVFEILRETWRLVEGMKSTVLLWMMVVGAGFALMFVLDMVIIGLLSGVWPLSPELFEVLGPQPWASVSNLVLSPFNTVVTLSALRIGMLRATGETPTITDLFTTHAFGRIWLFSALIQVLVMVLGLLHPYAPMAIWLVTIPTFWTSALMYERDCGIVDGVRYSAILMWRYISVPIACWITILASYVVATLTCGIALLWVIPYMLIFVGVAYRTLCGIRDVP
ncbi:MAG: hypothetical protein AAFV53_22470 [Myxococcota bacterium]